MTKQAISTINHRVLAIYGDQDASVFSLPRGATLSELCEELAHHAPRNGAMPQHVEINLAR